MAEKRKNHDDDAEKSSDRSSAASANKNEIEKAKKDAVIEEFLKKRDKKARAVSWVLTLSAIVLLVLMVFDIISVFTVENLPQNASQHNLSFVGFWIFHILYGILGYSMLLAPIILFGFGVFWKEIVKKGARASKIISCTVFVLLLNILIHTFVNWSSLAQADPVFPGFTEVLEKSHSLRFGGYIAGFFAYILKRLIAFPGTITLCVIGMLVSAIFLFNLDPSKLVDRIRYAISERREIDKETRKIKREFAERDREEKSKKRREDHADRVRSAEIEKRNAKNKSQSAEKSETRAKAVKSEDSEEKFVAVAPVAAEPEKIEEKKAPIPVHTADAEDPVPEKDGDGFDDDEGIDEVFRGDKDDFVRAEAEDMNFDSVFSGDKSAADTEKSTDAVLSDTSASTDGGESDEYVYTVPPMDLLKLGSNAYGASENEVNENIEILKDTFGNFNIKIREITCTKGPTVTRYEVKPEAGVRVRQISGLQDDIALSLAKSGVRIEAPIPGKAAVGIEVPNDRASAVNFRNIIDTPEFASQKSKIAVGLGVDVSGKPIFCDLEKMPHLLIAGTTGSGKSVCINSIIMSIVYHSTPEDVKMVLIDPKKVEFTPYRDMPFLYTPIVSEPKRAAGALASMVAEMEHRFELIESVGARNIIGYNEITKNDPERKYLPRIVVVIDELADLMMTAKADVENSICRIAQKARAAGIHLVIGTQRPSVDVITGLIKANVPSRIAFTVVSQVDSRTIIDIAGAEKLCGRGDMLYSPVGSPKPMRVQGAFISDGEIEDVITFLKENNAPVHYDDEFIQSIAEQTARFNESSSEGEYSSGADIPVGDGEDPKLYDALKLAIDTKKVSTSLMQRKLGIGYGRAAKILDSLEEMGYISAPDGNKPREVLITAEQFAELMAK